MSATPHGLFRPISECNICLDEFSAVVPARIPHVFACGHSVCSECVEQLQKVATEVCSFCKQPVSMPPPKNFVLIELLQQLSVEAEPKPRHAPGSAGDWIEALCIHATEPVDTTPVGGPREKIYMNERGKLVVPDSIVESALNWYENPVLPPSPLQPDPLTGYKGADCRDPRPKYAGKSIEIMCVKTVSGEYYELGQWEKLYDKERRDRCKKYIAEFNAKRCLKYMYTHH